VLQSDLMLGSDCTQIVKLLFGIKLHSRMTIKACLAFIGWHKAGRQASQQAGSKAQHFPSLSGWKGTASGQDCQDKGRLRPSKGKEGSFQWERPLWHC